MMVPGSSPVPFWMARLMLSAGMFSDLAARIAVRRRGLESGSPPLMRAATLISLMILVKILPRRASAAPFLCLMVAHLEWPDIRKPSFQLFAFVDIGQFIVPAPRALENSSS